MEQKRVLFIDDEEGMCRMVEAVLLDEGYAVTTYTSPVEAMEAYRSGAFDVVISDVKMPRMGGLEVLARIRAQEPAPPVIMITAFATVETSIQALRKGAYDMLTKPFEPEEIIHRVRNALRQNELLTENIELKQELSDRERFSQIIGESPALLALLETADKVAVRDFPVLITGDSGTGKELVAQAIHRQSPRHERRFVAINCGALPHSLLESELFGCRKGAYTGADEERVGLVQAADGGTLFLDEVGNLPLDVQKVLLRFLQEKEFYRVGDNEPTRVDVRVVSATNASLEEAVQSGEFREDLYYRLAVAKLTLPPLRDRREDIPLLAAHFVREQNQKFDTAIGGFTPAAMAGLCGHDWPGNVRQLRNVIEASMAVEAGEWITVESLGQFLGQLPGQSGGGTEAAPDAAADYAASLSRFESDYFSELLERFDGNAELAAQSAGVNVATLYRKIKKYDLK